MSVATVEPIGMSDRSPSERISFTMVRLAADIGPPLQTRLLVLDLLGVRSLPFLSRRNYYYEFLHLIPWGVLVGTIEGNAASIIVKQTFHGSNFLVATATATPIGALLFSSFWGVLCIGREKLRLTTLFGAATAMCAATVCLTPQTEFGGLLFVIQMAAAQVFLSGTVTVRASLWKHNYPPQYRGKIAARLQAVRLMVSVTVLIGVSFLFDHDPSTYRFVYPVVAVVGLFALTILQRLHVRHEKSELRMAADRSGHDRTGVQRARVRDSLSPIYVLRGMIGVLRNDRRYARYMGIQMLLGISVQLVMPVLVIVLADAIDKYRANMLIIDILPRLTMFLLLRRWGMLFDRVGVNRFRVFTGSFASMGLLLGAVATYLITTTGGASAGALMFAIVLFTVRGMLHGAHQGGGSLAWNLGHLHFSGRHNAEIYMATHQTLTGIRGFVAPYVGAVLWHYVGWGVWLVAFGMCVTSVVGFHLLSRGDAPDHRPV
jgi:hypothetical protein